MLLSHEKPDVMWCEKPDLKNAKKSSENNNKKDGIWWEKNNQFMLWVLIPVVLIFNPKECLNNFPSLRYVFTKTSWPMVSSAKMTNLI